MKKYRIATGDTILDLEESMHILARAGYRPLEGSKIEAVSYVVKVYETPYHDEQRAVKFTREMVYEGEE